MEVYCKKIFNGGVLEYKLIKSRRENSDFGEYTAYGLRAKYITHFSFDYVNLDNVSEKPGPVLQIIKSLFDNNVPPCKAVEEIENYLHTLIR